MIDDKERAKAELAEFVHLMRNEGWTIPSVPKCGKCGSKCGACGKKELMDDCHYETELPTVETRDEGSKARETENPCAAKHESAVRVLQKRRKARKQT